MRNLSGSEELNLALYGGGQYYGKGEGHNSIYETSSNSYFSAYSESEEESDDEEVVEYSVGEMARLLSLNEQDMLNSSDEEGEEDKAEKAGRKPGVPHTSIKSPRSRKRGSASETAFPEGTKSVTTSTHKLRLEPVGVFWDIENCPVPINKSAFGVAAKMRNEFISGKREAEFMCVCDITKERKEVTDELHKAQVGNQNTTFT